MKEHEKVFSQLEKDTYDLLAVISGIRAMKLIKKDVENDEGGFNMCKAFDDMMRDSRREGKLEGEREGRLEGRREGKLEGNLEGELRGKNLMGKLIQKLISTGRIDDLMHASQDDGYCDKLMVEFGIK